MVLSPQGNFHEQVLQALNQIQGSVFEKHSRLSCGFLSYEFIYFWLEILYYVKPEVLTLIPYYTSEGAALDRQGTCPNRQTGVLQAHSAPGSQAFNPAICRGMDRVIAESQLITGCSSTDGLIKVVSRPTAAAHSVSFEVAESSRDTFDYQLT